MVTFLFLIIVGAAAGFIATRVMGFETNALTTVALGVIGAVIGGFVLRVALMLTGLAAGFIGALLGAILVIWIWRRFFEKS